MPKLLQFLQNRWIARAITLAVALSGVAVFSYASLPLPWLLGAMFACLIAAFIRVPMKGFGTLSVLMRTILGVAVGASIQPDIFNRLPEMAASLAFIPLFIFMIGLIGYPYFRYIWKYDKPTAYYSAMPGGLQDMLVFGEEAGGHVRTMSLLQATRVLVIVSIIPVLLSYAYDISVADQGSPGLPWTAIPVFELVLMAICGVAGWKIAECLGIFGASIVGPLVLTAIISLCGLIEHRPPFEAIIAAQLFIGMAVGVKYAGITLAELTTTVFAGLIYCVILAALAFGFESIVTGLDFAPRLEGLLAFAPGGQAEMAVLAIVAGADVAFVITHHLLRMIIVILGAPIFARWL